MKKIFYFLSFLFLACCCNAESTAVIQIGMTKQEVKSLYEEARFSKVGGESTSVVTTIYGKKAIAGVFFSDDGIVNMISYRFTTKHEEIEPFRGDANDYFELFHSVMNEIKKHAKDGVLFIRLDGVELSGADKMVVEPSYSNIYRNVISYSFVMDGVTSVLRINGGDYSRLKNEGAVWLTMGNRPVLGVPHTSATDKNIKSKLDAE